MVFRADLIEMLEVDAHSERLVFLGHHDNIGEPLVVVYLANEVGCQKFSHLFSDCLPFVCGGPTQAFSDRPSGGIHMQSVLSQLPGYTWHVRGFPCEDVPVLLRRNWVSSASYLGSRVVEMFVGAAVASVGWMLTFFVSPAD